MMLGCERKPVEVVTTPLMPISLFKCSTLRQANTLVDMALPEKGQIEPEISNVAILQTVADAHEEFLFDGAMVGIEFETQFGRRFVEDRERLLGCAE